MKIPINGKNNKKDLLVSEKEINVIFNDKFRDPRTVEDKLLRDMEEFCYQISHKIVELKSINPRIILKSIKFGEEIPEMNAILLEIMAIGELDISSKRVGYRKLIPRRDLE